MHVIQTFIDELPTLQFESFLQKLGPEEVRQSTAAAHLEQENK